MAARHWDAGKQQWSSSAHGAAAKFRAGDDAVLDADTGTAKVDLRGFGPRFIRTGGFKGSVVLPNGSVVDFSTGRKRA